MNNCFAFRFALEPDYRIPCIALMPIQLPWLDIPNNA